MTGTAALEQRLREQQGALSAADRRFAEVLLAHPRELLGFSATELAAQAGVSKATAARFFRRLGYEDFASFRQQLREQLSAQSPLQQLAAPSRTRRQPPAAALLAQHVQRDAARLATLAETLAEADLQTAVGQLAQARRIWVLGYRNSQAGAYYAQALLCQLRPGVHLLHDAAGRDAELLAEVEAGDLLLAVDFRRRTRRLALAVQACTEAGAQVLLLTDTRVSAPGARAATVLVCPPLDAQVFDSYVHLFSLVNFLATRLANRLARPARNRLARIEQLHAQLGDLQAD